VTCGVRPVRIIESNESLVEVYLRSSKTDYSSPRLERLHNSWGTQLFPFQSVLRFSQRSDDRHISMFWGASFTAYSRITDSRFFLSPFQPFRLSLDSVASFCFSRCSSSKKVQQLGLLHLSNRGATDHQSGWVSLLGLRHHVCPQTVEESVVRDRRPRQQVTKQLLQIFTGKMCNRLPQWEDKAGLGLFRH
jgi:hypothetical protein